MITCRSVLRIRLCVALRAVYCLREGHRRIRGSMAPYMHELITAKQGIDMLRLQPCCSQQCAQLIIAATQASQQTSSTPNALNLHSANTKSSPCCKVVIDHYAASRMEIISNRAGRRKKRFVGITWHRKLTSHRRRIGPRCSRLTRTSLAWPTSSCNGRHRCIRTALRWWPVSCPCWQGA